MPTKSRSENVPDALRPIYDEIVGYTDDFCGQHLNEEYAQLSRSMAAALARKRPSPLLGGTNRTWACGIVYTVGMVNFLFDRAQTPHMAAQVLCAEFGLSPGTGSAKCKQIRQILKIRGQFDPAWTLPSKIEDNPLAWLISVNGFLVDARHVEREIQEEAYRRGLIPYLPDRSTS